LVNGFYVLVNVITDKVNANSVVANGFYDLANGFLGIDN
jgi:hypothetical protein